VTQCFKQQSKKRFSALPEEPIYFRCFGGKAAKTTEINGCSTLPEAKNARCGLSNHTDYVTTPNSQELGFSVHPAVF
jgi:hypothetical protein